MDRLFSISDLSQLSGPLVLVGGTFDGVHLGHQALIHRAQEEALSCGGRVVVMTFDQHPMAFLRPEKAPQLLSPTSQKIDLIASLGVEALLLLPFNEALAATPAEEFIQNIATAAHPLQAMIVGATWSFGQGGKGNLALLKQLGQQLSFSVITMDPVKVDGEVVSSTRIRQALGAGRLEEAALCLGRSPVLTGVVVKGAGLGKKINFPTANLALEKVQLPPDGVYAARVQIAGVSYDGVANIGVRPTLTTAGLRTVEVHLFNFEADLYGQELKMELVSFLRSEIAFSNLEELRLQIMKDVVIAQEKLTAMERRRK